MTPPGGNSVVLERLDALRADVQEMKTTINLLSVDYQRFREAYIGEHVVVVEKVTAAHARIDRLDTRLEKFEEQLRPLLAWGRVLAFVGSILGASLITLTWSIITHQVVLSVP